MKKSLLLLLALMTAALLITAGCVTENAPVAKSGDTVSVEYTLTTDTGYTESNVGKNDPLQFTIDGGPMIPGFNDAVKGMKVGEKKTVVVPPEKGYGQRTNDLVMSALTLSDVEEYLKREAKIGDIFDIMIQTTTSVTPMSAQILTIDRDNDAITYSVNQRHAGENLTFEITLLSIDKKA